MIIPITALSGSKPKGTKITTLDNKYVFLLECVNDLSQLVQEVGDIIIRDMGNGDIDIVIYDDYYE